MQFCDFAGQASMAFAGADNPTTAPVPIKAAPAADRNNSRLFVTLLGWYAVACNASRAVDTKKSFIMNGV